MESLRAELTAPNGRKYIQPTGLFINNEWRRGRSGSLIESVDPAAESNIIKVHAASAEDVDAAVKAARAALAGSWREVDGPSRAVLLLKLAALVERNAEVLATVETWNNGKPYQVSLHEDVADVANTLRYYAGWADKIRGQTFELSPTKMAYTIREPIGVCGLIIPWNYPLSMASWKLGPSLACGNTVVLKPAEQTPISILVFAELVKEAGFPPGVVNVLNGYGSVAGAALASHPDINKIAFTGSTAVGKEIMKLAAGTLKTITLETGGKSPVIIMDDCDLDEAVKWAHLGVMSNQGQICTATSRILVQESIYSQFIDRFVRFVQHTSKLGDPFRSDTYQGPQVSKQQLERVSAYVDIGEAAGATLLMGGDKRQSSRGQGFFITPTVFTDVTRSMRIFNEEIFGPFCTITKFRSEDEALDMANDSMYGLGSAIFTKDLVRAHRMARMIEAGTVWINSSQDSDFRVPFGMSRSQLAKRKSSLTVSRRTEAKWYRPRTGRGRHRSIHYREGDPRQSRLQIVRTLIRKCAECRMRRRVK